MATTCKLIAKVSLGTAASAIEFISIPATYSDLVVTYSLREETTNNSVVIVGFNGDTSNSYSWRRLQADGSSASSQSGTSGSSLDTLICAPSNSTANTFGSGEIYIPNYAGSTNKSLSTTSVGENNGAVAYMRLGAGLWASTSAITSISLKPLTAVNWAANSSAYLFGITKA